MHLRGARCKSRRLLPHLQFLLTVVEAFYHSKSARISLVSLLVVEFPLLLHSFQLLLTLQGTTNYVMVQYYLSNCFRTQAALKRVTRLTATKNVFEYYLSVTPTK